MLKPAAVEDCRAAAHAFAKLTKDAPAVIFSTPWLYRRKLYSAVLVMQGGEITDIRYKHFLPNYGVFDEARVFKAGPLPKPVDICGVSIGLPVCEDLWHKGVATAPRQARRRNSYFAKWIALSPHSPRRAPRSRGRAPRMRGTTAGLCQPSRRAGRTGI